MKRSFMPATLLILIGLALPASAQEKPALPPGIPAGSTAHRDLEYVAGGHERQKLDLYLPANATGPLPVVVWIHGGGWARGDKADKHFQAGMLLDKGYAVASVNYRLSEWFNLSDKAMAALRTASVPEATLAKLKPLQGKGINARHHFVEALAKALTKEELEQYREAILIHASQAAVFPAQIEDCKAAVRWLRANAKKYNLDPDHIGAWGASAGGHLAAMLGTTAHVKELEGTGSNLDQPSRVQAVVNFFGPIDLSKMPPPKPPRTLADSFVTKFLGGPVSEKAELVRKADPRTYITKDAAPTLIIQGDKDDVVPPEHSQALEEALKKAGIEVELVLVKGVAHSGDKVMTEDNRKKIVDFFDKHLKPKK